MQGKKKRGAKRALVIPLWLNQISKIVFNYRFGLIQFRKLFSQVLTHHDYFLPDGFMETEQFHSLIRHLYYGRQNSLKIIFEYFERNFNKNVKFSTFVRNLTDQLMSWRVKNGNPAFEVD